jgi:hypothetical protein
MKGRTRDRSMREHPDIDQLKRQAKKLLNAFIAGEPVAYALSACSRSHSLETRALWGRLPTCGRLSIGLLWGSQSWLQPAFSRLSSPGHPLVSAARDAPVGDRLSLV